MKIVFSFKNRSGISDPSQEAREKLIGECKTYHVVFCHSNEEVVKHLPETEILCCFNPGFSGDFLPKAPKLKWIHSLAAGVDAFLIPEIINSGILLSNSSGVHPIPIAEHVFGMLLSFERGIHLSIRSQERSKWDTSFPVGELSGKAFCIVGTGRIGSEIARIAKSFGCKVIGVNRSGKKENNFDEIMANSRLNDALPDADYVVSVVPLTKDTVHLFGKQQFESMKRTAVFCNVGRGKSVDEKALVTALESNIIRAACLDVFEEEPLPASSPLWKMPNAIITPHIAGNTPHYLDRALEIFLENFKAYAEGEEMPTQVNKKLGY